MRADRRQLLRSAVASGAYAGFALAPYEISAQPAALVLGTATPGGGFPVYAAALIATLKTVDPEFVIEARNTKGSAENIGFLERGDIDLGLMTGEVFHEAVAGIGRPPSRVKIVFAMYSQPGMFVLRADNPARSIADLRGQPVVFGAAGSGLVVLARYVLDGMGLDMERDFRPIFLDRAGDGPAMVIEGRAAALWGAGVGWPGFKTVADAGARFFAPSEAEVRAIAAKHRFLKPMTIPAGSYRGLDAPIASVGSWSVIVARPDLDDARAYRFARALHGAERELGKGLPQALETTATNTVGAIDNPGFIHPGAARYFREIGLLN